MGVVSRCWKEKASCKRGESEPGIDIWSCCISLQLNKPETGGTRSPGVTDLLREII